MIIHCFFESLDYLIAEILAPDEWALQVRLSVGTLFLEPLK